jgi:hypothetical protein
MVPGWKAKKLLITQLVLIEEVNLQKCPPVFSAKPILILVTVS